MTARTSPETRAELALDACSVLYVSHGTRATDRMGRLVNALPDLLADLADAEAEQERLTAALRLAQARAADAAVLPDLLAEAWDEGHHAGHEDARAVQATYPEPTPNPYRTEETR